MNKKQARKIALEIAIGLIDNEIRNPTGMASPEDEDGFYNPDEADAQKIFEQLEIVMAQLQSMRDKFAD